MAVLRALLLTDPLIVLDTLVFGTLSLLASLVDKTGATQHRVARVWARLLLASGGIRVRTDGIEKLDPHASYVIVANHLSLIDTPVMIAHLPLEFRFFAKRGLFKIPLLGGHLRRAGHFPVERSNPRAGLRTLGEGARMLRERGISVLVFPEGGRSATGMLKEFKAGAAYVAIKAGVPVVPVGITGTRENLPMGSAVVRPGRVAVRVGEPIPTAGLRPQDHEELTRRLWREVAGLTGQGGPVQ